MEDRIQTDKYISAVAEINGWIENGRSKLDKIETIKVVFDGIFHRLVGGILRLVDPIFHPSRWNNHSNA